jgi:hypothetical protein
MSEPTQESLEPCASLTDGSTVDAVMGMVAEGRHSLAEIAAALGLPRRELHAWLTKDIANQDRYTRAVAVAETARKERVRNELETIAFFDFKECFDLLTDGLLPPPKLPDRARRVVQKYKETTIKNAINGGGAITITRSLEMYNRIQALELLGKELRMFVEPHEHTLINPYVAQEIPVAKRLEDPDPPRAALPIIDAEFTEVPK